MIIETKIDFYKYVRLMYVLTYRKPITIFITFIGLVMFVSSILYFLNFNIPFDSPPYFQIIFGFTTIAYLPFSIFRKAKSNFSSSGRLQEKIIYEFTDEKMKIIGETFNSELGWEKTYKILELNAWVLIFGNKLTANVIPKEFFGEKIIEFRELIKTKTFINQKLKN
jgi:hypothetical protein